MDRNSFFYFTFSSHLLFHPLVFWLTKTTNITIKHFKHASNMNFSLFTLIEVKIQQKLNLSKTYLLSSTSIIIEASCALCFQTQHLFKSIQFDCDFVLQSINIHTFDQWMMTYIKSCPSLTNDLDRTLVGRHAILWGEIKQRQREREIVRDVVSV